MSATGAYLAIKFKTKRCPTTKPHIRMHSYQTLVAKMLIAMVKGVAG
jgi:hypothetical protein